jgi:uncharacterized protein YndB with AHSA1/START domain
LSDMPPIHREVVVELALDDAFELFTARIGAWWPVAELSVFGPGALVAFTEGEIVETLGDQTSSWGRVTEWQPGARLAFSWHPGRAVDRASQVSVSFTAQGPQETLVVLEHAGWEQFDDPAAARREYGQGWPGVLGCYRDAATPSPDLRPA